MPGPAATIARAFTPNPRSVVSELYALPPAEFTRARSAKASALAQAGRTAEAREVRQLRRPAGALWAVNRLAHVDPRGLADFVATVARVRRTQLGDPRAAADAGRRQRAELDALVDRAGALLGELARDAAELAQKLAAARARVREARRASKTAAASARKGRRAPDR